MRMWGDTDELNDNVGIHKVLGEGIFLGHGVHNTKQYFLHIYQFIKKKEKKNPAKNYWRKIINGV